MAWLLTAVAGPARLLAAGHELVEDPAQDALPPREGGAVRGHDGIRVRLAGLGPDEVQRVDLEGADEARVQALEVEHDDVRVEAGEGLEDVPSALRLHDLGLRADARGDDPAPSELGEVEEVEGGDRGGDAVEGEAGEAAALDRELDEAEPLEHLEGEAGVGAVVLDEALPVLLEEPQDLLGAAAPGEGLALAEDRAGDRVEAVVLHPDEGAAQQLDPVEDDAPGDRRLTRPPRPALRRGGGGSPAPARARAARRDGRRAGRARRGRSRPRSSR